MLANNSLVGSVELFNVPVNIIINMSEVNMYKIHPIFFCKMQLL